MKLFRKDYNKLMWAWVVWAFRKVDKEEADWIEVNLDDSISQDVVTMIRDWDKVKNNTYNFSK